MARFPALRPTCYQRLDGRSVLIMTTEKSQTEHIVNAAKQQMASFFVINCVLLSKLLLGFFLMHFWACSQNDFLCSWLEMFDWEVGSQIELTVGNLSIYFIRVLST